MWKGPPKGLMGGLSRVTQLTERGKGQRWEKQSSQSHSAVSTGGIIFTLPTHRPLSATRDFPSWVICPTWKCLALNGKAWGHFQNPIPNLYSLQEGFANSLSLKSKMVNNFGFETGLGHCNAQAAEGNMETNQDSCTPTKSCIWTLKLKFHVIFTSSNIPFVSSFLNHSEVYKSSSAHGIYKTVGCSLPTPDWQGHTRCSWMWCFSSPKRSRES